uniref:Uncharacterized protein n=1 Tax=Romanomermis culicivorax TaxID=13658 RepID=A0A915L790_ROMCU
MSNTKKIAEDFNWDAYLAQTNAVAAPADCFWQAPDPPPNKFDDEMILEAYDPRFPSIRCIAEVTAVYGPKIRLRMLGAGDNDDIWIIVDSHQIRPIGTADNQGILIQAPFTSSSDDEEDQIEPEDINI